MLRTEVMNEPLGRTDEERAYYALSSKVYAVFAHVYDVAALPLLRLRREVVDAVRPGPDARVLDVATGTGGQALAFARAAREVVGVDLSDAMLRVARRKCCAPNVTFLRADAAELPFEDASFDVACISFALHEMPASVRDRVMREMARVTRAGGAVVVADHAPPRGPATWLAHRFVSLYEGRLYEEFLRADLDELLRVAGFRVRAESRALFGVARVITGTRLGAVRPDAGLSA